MALTERSALELAHLVAARDVRAVDVVAEHLARSVDLGARLGAFARLTPDAALARAADLDAGLDRGEPAPPLAGVPCPIKDLSPVAGVGWEGGSAAMAGTIADVDDDVVGWFAAAGTISTGKTSTPEFGLPCYTEPEGGRPAVTPWDPSRMAGGSSGGAAVAVAAGMAPIAHASDGGGSIRIPASCCGLVGLKASRGRVGTGRLRQPGPGLTTDGVLSRTVGDTAAALDALSGRGVGETYTAPIVPPTFLEASRRDPGRLRIGVLTTPVIAEADVHPVCADAVDATVAALTRAGHDVVQAPVPFPADHWLAFRSVWAVGAATIPIPAEAELALRPLTRWLRETGRRVSGVEYAQALGTIQRLTREVALAWDGFDAVLTPTLAQPPLPVGALRDDDDPAGDFAAQTRFTPWTSVANLTGRPAISLPLHSAAVDGSILPIGVMFFGRFGEDALLLALAAQLEAEVGWRHPFVSAPA